MKFGNAEQDDLWSYLTEAQETNSEKRLEKVYVKKVMDSWTLQSGYPVVTLIRNYKKGSAQLDQKRFLLTTTSSNQSQPVVASESESKPYLWEIPITFVSKSKAADEQWAPTTKLWMHKDQSTINLYSLSSPLPLVSLIDLFFFFSVPH